MQKTLRTGGKWNWMEDEEYRGRKSQNKEDGEVQTGSREGVQQEDISEDSK